MSFQNNFTEGIELTEKCQKSIDMDDSKKYGYAGIPEDKTKNNDSGKGMKYNFACHHAITFSSRFVRLYMHQFLFHLFYFSELH